MGPSRFLLKFPDARAEAAYRASRIPYRLHNTRLTAAVVACMWSAFGILDRVILPEQTPSALAVRGVGVVLAVVIVAMTYMRMPGPWIQPWAFAFLALNICLVFGLKLTIPPEADPQFRTLPLFMLVASAAFVVTGVSFVEGVAAAALSCLGYALVAGIFKPEPPKVFSYEFPFLLWSATIAAISAYMLERTARLSFVQQQALSRAEGEIRRLLYNVLPPSIAARKEAGEVTIADSYEDITVLFADIVGFTAKADAMSSEAVVGLLNELFTRFDRIVAKHRLEKIKTIGDCYMVAASVPDTRPNHAREIAAVALALRAEASLVRFPDGSPVQVKIGVASGPVTAGIIGDTKFLFDVWGDTVNTASRLEMSAAGGEILLTEATRSALTPEFVCEGPLVFDLKGKGATSAWRLMARVDVKDAPAAE